jgi:hypothetical protein
MLCEKLEQKNPLASQFGEADQQHDYNDFIDFRDYKRSTSHPENKNGSASNRKG